MAGRWRLLGSLVGAAVAAAALADPAAAALLGPPRLPPERQIFIASRAGDVVKQITHDRRSHYDPVWSPNGRLIADYVFIGERTKVEVLTRKGRLVRRFDAGSELTDTPAGWSPDSRRLAFASSYNNPSRDATDGRLVTVSVASGRRRVLSDLAAGRPAWASDGRSLLYVRGDIIPSSVFGEPVDYNTGDLWTVRADGTGSHEVVHKVATPAIYSPNGRRILFFRSPGSSGEYVVWSALADGTRQVARSGQFSAADAHWAPRGRGIWVLAAGQRHARAVLLTPSGGRRRLPSAIRSGPMDWSPDGRPIVWGDGPRIRSIRPNGSRKRELFRFHGTGGCDWLEWNPGGRRFLVVCAQDSGSD